MKKIISLLFFAITFLITTYTFAFTPPPKPTDGFLLDQANLLSATEQSRIKQKLASIEQQTGNEIAVLILPSLTGESVEDVAYHTFNTWKIGKEGKDNGVLLLIAMQDRKTRIETGKGVGGELTDLQSKQILNTMKTYFKRKEFAAGIEVSVDKIAGSLDSRGQPDVSTESADDTGTVLFVVFLVLGLAICLGIYLSGRSGKTRRRYSSYNSDYNSSYSSSTFNFFETGSSSGSSSSGSSFDFGGGSSGGGGSSDDW